MTDSKDCWHPASTAVPDGQVCALRCRDALGYYSVPGQHFLHDDGHWYLINPATRVEAEVTHWRPLLDSGGAGDCGAD